MRGTREKTTQDVTITSWTTCAQYSFHGLIQTAVTDEVSSGLVRTRSVLVRAVSLSVVRCVLCSSRPFHNQRVVRLKRHKEKLDWNNTSVATLLKQQVGCELTFVSGLDHFNVPTIRHRSIQSSSMFFPHFPTKVKGIKTCGCRHTSHIEIQ